MIGRIIGHYEILEKLGEGGMGVVYKARDASLNRFVAIKVLPAGKLGDPERIRRFTQEARAASALNHPNIITIHEIGCEQGEHFIVMEYVQGKTLDRLIARKGMPVGEVLRLSVQIADALAAAARAGVIHRDVKPGNVMVSDSGHVKVLDFGLAKLSEPEAPPEGETVTVRAAVEERPRTSEGAVLGTVSYMSPEQVQGKALDQRSDIFSFGALLYEMTAGQRAFRGENKMSTISAILRDDPKPAMEVSPDVPRELDRIITRCLRKDPERRFQHMADVRVALLELKEESESGKLQSLPMASRQAVSTRWLILCGCAVIALGLALVFAFRSHTASVSEPVVHMVPFTVYSGPQGAPTFSPDGNQIAFPWTGDQGNILHIYVKVIGTETPLRVTAGNFSDDAPAWAPDGKSIAFARALPSDITGIYQVSPLGGHERRIAELNRAGRTLVNWSPDGKWLVTSGREAPDKPARIFVISVDSGEKRVISFGSARDETSPVLSPDGRWLAFYRTVTIPDSPCLVAEMDDHLQPKGEPRQFAAAGSFAFTPDSKEIVFAGGGGHAVGGQFWRVPVKGNTPARRIPIASEGANFLTIAPHGDRMAFSRRNLNIDIWRIPVIGPGKTGEPSRVLASSRVDLVRPHAFSPDGRKIAFESDRTGVMSVWIANADGSDPRLLFGDEKYGTSGSPAWSPDGRWIVFDTRKDGDAEIYVISAEGGAARRLTTNPADDVIPCWSHDGKWIYFGSNRTGRPEIFKMPASGGEAIQLTRNGGWAALESGDGKFLYFTRMRPATGGSTLALTIAANNPVLRIPVNGGEETEIVDAVGERSWAVADQGIWFLWPAGTSRTELRFFSSETRKVSTAATTSKPAMAALDLSQDGRALLYNEFESSRSEIVLVEGFK